MRVANGIGRQPTANTADKTSRRSERGLRGEPDGGGEARASWDWHGKSRRWRQRIATTEIKVLLRLSCQSLSLPRPATFLVVGRKTPVTIGQVQVDFRIDVAC